MSKRIAISPEIVADVLTAALRRCCICFALRSDMGEKKGQIAHLDRNPRNSSIDNLAFLCLEHHDAYDSKSSQSKGLTITEVKRYRAELHAFVAGGGLERRLHHSEEAPQYPRPQGKNGTDLRPSVRDLGYESTLHERQGPPAMKPASLIIGRGADTAALPEVSQWTDIDLMLYVCHEILSRHVGFAPGIIVSLKNLLAAATVRTERDRLYEIVQNCLHNGWLRWSAADLDQAVKVTTSGAELVQNLRFSDAEWTGDRRQTVSEILSVAIRHALGTVLWLGPTESIERVVVTDEYIDVQVRHEWGALLRNKFTRPDWLVDLASARRFAKEIGNIPIDELKAQTLSD